jgi:hypothetical protein
MLKINDHINIIINILKFGKFAIFLIFLNLSIICCCCIKSHNNDNDERVMKYYYKVLISLVIIHVFLSFGVNFFCNLTSHEGKIVVCSWMTRKVDKFDNNIIVYLYFHLQFLIIRTNNLDHSTTTTTTTFK